MTDKWCQFLSDTGLDSRRKYELDRVLAGKTTIMGVDSVWLDSDFVMEVASVKPKYLWNVDHSLLNQDICDKAVEVEPSSINFIPEQFVHSDMARAVVEHDGALITKIPRGFLTDELCEISASTSIFGLMRMNDKAKAEHLALQHPEFGLGVLEFVAAEKQTNGFIRQCCRHNSRCSAFDLSHWLNFEVLDEKLAAHVVANCSNVYPYLPSELKTERTTKVAFNQYFNELAKVPLSLRNYDICVLALKADCENLEHVPEALMTQELCDLASEGRDGGFRLSAIPECNKTELVCLNSLSYWNSAKDNLAAVPSEFLENYDFLIKAVKTNRHLLPLLKPYVEKVAH